jgi:septum formation protein
MSEAPAPRLVLASGSPRRRDLLTRAGLRFEVRPADIPEHREAGEEPAAFAARMALAKAATVARTLADGPPRLVLGADTIVVLGSQVLGKPSGPEQAVAMLGQLLGRTHRVITAVALVDSSSGRTRHALVESRVTMGTAAPRALRAYAATGEPLDKAGAYAAQGEGRRFVERIEGSESNVIGLPVEETLALLREAGEARTP